MTKLKALFSFCHFIILQFWFTAHSYIKYRISGNYHRFEPKTVNLGNNGNNVRNYLNINKKQRNVHDKGLQGFTIYLAMNKSVTQFCKV